MKTELHVTSDIFNKVEAPIIAADYALFCDKYAAMIAKPWNEWADDEACFGCPSYMENADFFCREFNKFKFGQERIEPEDQPPWWENPAFVIPKKEHLRHRGRGEGMSAWKLCLIALFAGYFSGFAIDILFAVFGLKRRQRG